VLGGIHLHFDGGEIPNGGMEPSSVAEAFDEVEDIASGFGAGFVAAMMDELCLEGVTEALSRRVVISNRLSSSSMR